MKVFKLKMDGANRGLLLAGLLSVGFGLFWALSGHRQEFLESYLLGFLFWAGIPIGSLAIFLVHCLTRGSWGFFIRPYYRAAVQTLPLVAVFFIPVLLGLADIYPWAKATAAADPIVAFKRPYLNPVFFQLRALFYFGLWIWIAGIVDRKAKLLLARADDEARVKMQLAAGLSMLAFAFSASFAAFDWSMSLLPQWYSTIYGILTIISQALLALAFLVCVSSKGVMAAGEKASSAYHDLGNLLLALLMLWAYMAFSQFFIIWSGNLPEEIIWYLPRLKNGWQFLGAILAIGHFGLPFLLLLNRTLKRSIPLLAKVAAWIIVMRFVDVAWVVLPNFRAAPIASAGLLNIVVPLGIGAFWLAFFRSKLEQTLLEEKKL